MNIMRIKTKDVQSFFRKKLSMGLILRIMSRMMLLGCIYTVLTRRYTRGIQCYRTEMFWNIRNKQTTSTENRINGIRRTWPVLSLNHTSNHRVESVETWIKNVNTLTKHFWTLSVNKWHCHPKLKNCLHAQNLVVFFKQRKMWSQIRQDGDERRRTPLILYSSLSYYTHSQLSSKITYRPPIIIILLRWGVIIS